MKSLMEWECTLFGDIYKTNLTIFNKWTRKLNEWENSDKTSRSKKKNERNQVVCNGKTEQF